MRLYKFGYGNTSYTTIGNDKSKKAKVFPTIHFDKLNPPNTKLLSYRGTLGVYGTGTAKQCRYLQTCSYHVRSRDTTKRFKVCRELSTLQLVRTRAVSNTTMNALTTRTSEEDSVPIAITRSECKTMPRASQDNDGSRVRAGSDAGVSLCRFCRS